MAKSKMRAVCAALGLLATSAPAFAAPAGPAPVGTTQPQSEAPEDMHLLAKFIKIMLRYSPAGPADDEAPEAVAEMSDFRVCLTEPADEAYSLHDLQNLSVHNWRINVDIVPSPASFSSDCDLAFISKDEVDAVDYDELTRAGVLTMSDAYDFARKGGVVEVEFKDDGIAFFIGYHKIRKTALSPSSKFLRLATHVYR